MKTIQLPLNKEVISKLTVGEIVYLNGSMLVMRDAAHIKICELIKAGKSLPVNFEDECIYYMAPTPFTEDRIIGSAGPTTSKRMDVFMPTLIAKGLLATVGKGERSEEVYNLIKKSGGIYFAAVGGAGAYYSKCVKAIEVIAFPELLAEAVYKISVVDFPVIVVCK